MSHLHDILNPQASVGNTEPESSLIAAEQEPQASSEDESDVSYASDEEIDELEASDPEDSEEHLTSPAIVRAKSEQPDESGYLLSPGTGDRAHNRPNQIVLPPEEPKSSSAPRKKSEKHDRKIDLRLHDHKNHDDCPDTLACLPDTDGRPQHTLPVILRCAILGSPRKRLTIREIYGAMESKYPYYRTAGQTWKQSVRHHLSLNRLFERQPRPVTDPGFGSYWTVNLLAPPGTKRPRKRGKKDPEAPNSASSSGSKGLHSNETSPTSHQSHPPIKFHFQPQSHPLPPEPPIAPPPVTLYPVSPLTRPSVPPPPFQPQPQQQSYSQLSLQNPHSHSPSASYPPPPQVPRPMQPSQQPMYSPSHAMYQSQRSMYPPPIQSPKTHHASHHVSPPAQHSKPKIPITNKSQQAVPVNVQMQSSSLQNSTQTHQQQKPKLDRTHTPPPLMSPTRLHSQRQHERQRNVQFPQEEHRMPSVSTPITPQSGLSSGFSSSGREPSYPPSSETEDGAHDTNGPTVSDDESESDVDMERPYGGRRRSLPHAFVATKPAPIFSLPPFSSLDQNRDDIVEHMRKEIAELRRTSAEAVSTSIRLTEQLALANSEVARSRQAVRDLEDMLHREAAKRKEAERMKEAETERRRLAEHTINNYAAQSQHAQAQAQSPPTRNRAP